MRRAAALIVGGGPAGSAAAIALARAGVRPLLIERSVGDRDVVCGGFLGWDALAALQRLGVDVAALGARPIRRLRLVARRHIVESRLPFAAAGLSRRRLDATLLAQAEQAGATLLRGRAVRAIEGRCARLDDDEEMEGEAIFLATGKHELRGAARDIGAKPGAVGLRNSLVASAELQGALAGTIELHGFEGGYAGLLVQEDESVNLCLSISRERMAAAGSPEAVLAEVAAEAPLLADRISGSIAGEWDAIAGVPYGWRARSTDAGCFRIGDQAAVIASLAGDGIAVALTSGQAAAGAYLAGGAAAAQDYQRAFARRAKAPLAIADLCRRAVERRSSRNLVMMLARIPGLAAAAARLTRIA